MGVIGRSDRLPGPGPIASHSTQKGQEPARSRPACHSSFPLSAGGTVGAAGSCVLVQLYCRESRERYREACFLSKTACSIQQMYLFLLASLSRMKRRREVFSFSADAHEPQTLPRFVELLSIEVSRMRKVSFQQRI